MENQDVLRTFVEHIAVQISTEINKKYQASVLVSGGGVYNDFLIDRIKLLSDNEIMVPSPDIIEFKEALIDLFDLSEEEIIQGVHLLYQIIF